jgi:hypothetical protein
MISVSVGSFWPGSNLPLRMLAAIWSTTSVTSPRERLAAKAVDTEMAAPENRQSSDI